MKKRSRFYTDKQGRVRHIGSRSSKKHTDDNWLLRAPTRSEKAGSFITIEDGRVIFIGGPSSGAGSTSASASASRLPRIYAKDFMGKSQLPIQAASGEDILDIQIGLNNAVRAADIDMSDVLLVPAKESVTGGSLMGLSSRGAYGESRGKEIIAINVGTIDSSIEREGLPALARWNGLSETITRSEFIQHVAAHEVGHKWYKTHKSIMPAWEQLTQTHDYVSVMAQYYRSTRENFADAFALYVNGQSLPDDVENFIYEALK